MMGCLRCGAEPDTGALCRPCAVEIKPCDGLIPDHLHSRIDSTEAEAWVIDGFGGAHAIGPFAGIGRHRDRELVVLASSVSREHAELRRTDTGWTVRDLGSRNGTFVDGLRAEAAVPLPGRALLKIGDVALWFIAEVVHEPAQQATVTMDAGKGRFVRYQLTRDDIELSVVTSDNDATTGALLWRRVGAERWAERSLTLLEFQLLRVLCQRAGEEARSPSQIRGCVPSKQLVSELPFQSKYANQENVRQVVLRLRGVLAEVGAAGMLAVAPGRGYYLACRASVVALE
jgi:FHA domain-containing protein